MPIQGMPQYRCFKTVSALRIQEVREVGYDSTTDENPLVAISFENPAFPPRTINLRGKPTPEAGWWYVQYEDGYISFSPAKAFEEGYMPLSMIPDEPKTLEDKIAQAINSVSAENGSNTPDFILAGFLHSVLRDFDTAMQARERWHGRNPSGQEIGSVDKDSHPFEGASDQASS